jgi:hypothetical protein
MLKLHSLSLHARFETASVPFSIRSRTEGMFLSDPVSVLERMCAWNKYCICECRCGVSGLWSLFDEAAFQQMNLWTSYSIRTKRGELATSWVNENDWTKKSRRSFSATCFKKEAKRPFHCASSACGELWSPINN